MIFGGVVEACATDAACDGVRDSELFLSVLESSGENKGAVPEVLCVQIQINPVEHPSKDGQEFSGLYWLVAGGGDFSFLAC